MALQAASYKGHGEVVRMLLDASAHVNAETRYFGTALQAASLHGHVDVVRMLLDAGARS
jgi:ankyrin repeat protein